MLPQTNAFHGENHHPFKWESGKPAALFVHGFPGTPDDMRDLAQVLHDQGWTVQGLLLPGFGSDISRLPLFSTEDWLNAIVYALGELREKHSPVVLVGHSMGGALSITAAQQVVVDGLILLAPFYRIDHLLWEGLPVIQRLWPMIKPFQFLKPDFTDPEFRDTMLTFVSHLDLDSPEGQAAVLEIEIPVRVFAQVRHAGQLAYAEAPAVRVPALVIQGLHDPVVHHGLTRQLAQRLGGALNLIELEGDHEINRSSSVSWERVRLEVLRFATHLVPAP